jgi:hypothetical protein
MSVAPAPNPPNMPDALPFADFPPSNENGPTLQDRRSVEKQPSIRNKKHVSKIIEAKKGLCGCTSIRGGLAVLLDAALFQTFLDLHKQDDDPKGLKSTLSDANSSLAVVNALLLSMIFPMSMAPDDWMEDAREGWVAQTFGLEWMFDEYWWTWWYDQSIVGFRIGLGAMMMAVCASVFQMLAINEIQDDNHAQVYINTISDHARKFPFRSMIIGLIAPFGFSVGIRHSLTYRTLLGVVGFNLTVGVIGAYLAYTIYHIMKAVYISVEEKDKFEQTSIPESTIAILVEEYFELKPEHFDIHDWLHKLSDVTDKGYAVPLTYCTRMLARKHFYIRSGKALGLELPPETIAKLCYEREES